MKRLAARWAIALMERAARWSPQARARFGRLLGGLLWTLAAPRRRITLVNLRLCFPELSDAERAALGRRTFSNLARALIDNAAWQIEAQRAGRPLWALWGGQPAVDLTWAVTRQPPAHMAAEAGEVCARYGFRTLKVKGGQGLETDLTALREIRAAVGDAVELYVDANSAYKQSQQSSLFIKIKINKLFKVFN